MNVLVIPEDFRKDQYILRPLVQAMMAALGKPHANVRVCQDPLLGGISQSMDWQNIEDILDRYRGMIQIFLLMVDRDGDAGRRAALDFLEKRAANYHGETTATILLSEHAWQEVEVWALAACEDLPGEWKWNEIRAEVDLKEQYFDRYVSAHGLTNEPAQGRVSLGARIAGKYPRVKTLCKEDVDALEQRLRAHFGRS